MTFSKFQRIQKIYDGQYLALTLVTLAEYDFFFIFCFPFVFRWVV